MGISQQKIEDLIEQAYWEFDALMKNKEFRYYSERDKFKMACRVAFNKEKANETNI